MNVTLRTDCGTEVVPIIMKDGPWVVHKSISDNIIGFCVSHAPSGGLVFPCGVLPSSTVHVQLREAADKARALGRVWSGDGRFTPAAERDISKIVNSSGDDEQRLMLPKDERFKWRQTKT